VSDQVSIGDYRLEISGDEVVVRDESGAIVETVELDETRGELTLPDGQKIDLTAVFADAGIEAFETAAGPANDNTGAINGGPTTFHPFHGTGSEFDGLDSAGALGGTSLGYEAPGADEQPDYDPNVEEPILVTWSSHDPWNIAENQLGGSFGKVINGNPADYTFEVSDPRFEVVDGVLQVREGVSFDYESEQGIDLEITVTSRTGDVRTLATHVDVTDVNEAQTDFFIDQTAVNENVPGAVVGPLTVADPDAGDSQSFQVSDSRFEVVDGQLKLKDGVSLDHESEPTVTVTVTATDSSGHQIQQTVTITVGDVNEAQTALALGENTVAENAAGAVVGTLTVADPDAGDGQSFEVSDARFEVVDGQLKLKDGVSLDHEGEPVVNITVTATDGAGHQIQQTFAITVGDVNEAQTGLSLDGNSVSENAAGAVIGTLTVADPDADDSQSFMVSDDRFEVVDGQLKLKDGVSLDHEGEPTVSVTVTATDGAGHQIQQTFTVNVGDVNEAPTAVNLAGNSLVENVAGAVIGALSAIDPDAGDTHSFAVSDNRFEVVDGQLKLKDGIAIDFETEPSLNVTVTATDSAGNTVQETFTLSVSDVNEAQTTLSLDHASVAENEAGAVIGALTVSDPDAGDSQSFQVSDSRFEVVNGQLKLKDGVSLDHESEPTVTVQVTATDSAGHQIQQDFAISVGDVNEAPLSLSLATDSTQLLLNGSFESNKLGNGQWQLFSGIDGWKTSTQVEIQNNVTNKASDGAQMVEMDADNKVDNIYQDVQTVAGHAYQLTFDAATRNDTKRTDTIEVYWNGVKIGSADPQSTTWQSNSFQVIGTGGIDRLEFREVGGSNDNYGGLLDNVALKGMGATVPENFGGVVIGALTVTDPDAGDSHAFSVSDSRFEVVDGQLKLKSDASFNYEAEKSVDVTVTATDTGGHQIQQTFTIAVGDVNEAQTALTWTGSSVAENAAGAVAGALWVADVDAGDAQRFTVSDSRFEVVNNQLKLKSGVSLDFEQASSVNVTVTATDKAGHQIQQTFTVNVTNVNEVQTGMTLGASKVAENAAGAVIGSLSVSDPDAGDTQSFKVSDSRFEVVDNQLKLKSGVSLDFEQGASVGVTVTATDSASHQYAKTFSIGVSDVNEAPTGIQLSSLDVNENASGATIGKLTTSDPDAGDTFSYQVSDNRFEVVGGQLQLKSGVSLDHEAEPTVNLKVTSTDSSGHAIAQSFTVSVANVNEAPAVTSTDGALENHIVNTSTAYNPVANAAVGAYLYSNDSAGVAKPASSLLNGVDASNMTLSAATPVTVTFQKEAAGNHNMVGTYQYDNSGNVVAGSVKFVWLDASASTEGKLGSTMAKDFLGYSQPNSISLGTMPAGTHVGFFTISNGANDAGNKTLLTNAAAGTSNQTDAMAAIASKLSVQVDANGNGQIMVGNSQMNGAVFFTHNKSLNTDFNGSSDIDHMASGVSANLPGQLVIGVEDLGGGGDKDFNDVVFSVDLGTYNVNKLTQTSHQPTVDFSDIDSNTLSQAVIHTTGFQAGDALNVPPSGSFNVTVNQSGADYTITIVGKTGAETVDQYETFANSIYFSTSSKSEGERHIEYSVTDSGGLTSNVSTADFGVTNSYEVSTSQLGNGATTLGSGDDLAHINSSGFGPLYMGDGHDTVHLARQDMAFGHNEAVQVHDAETLDATGYGANNVALSINDVLDITDADNRLTVVGDKGDTVTLSGDGSGNHWSVVSTDANFTTYAWSDPAHAAVVEISNQLNTQVS
jgi:VCBS repeat-containing protein